MFGWLLQTDDSIAGLILRLTLAVVIFPHGAQKVLGWFGGHGFKNTMQYFTSSGLPTWLALLVMVAEFLGASHFSRCHSPHLTDTTMAEARYGNLATRQII